MPLPDEMKDSWEGNKGKQRTGPVWTGPNGEGPKGGITYSALSRFLNCRERFRLHMVEGLRPEPHFDHKISFGDMWHLCEEELAHPQVGRPKDVDEGALTPSLFRSLREYVEEQLSQYPMQREEIVHWYNVVKVAFPVYVSYWKKHPDMTQRTALLQEQVFDIPYSLPSGRQVRLRGKWDSVDLVGASGNRSIWLQENKTKGDIKEETVVRNLTFDLQTMLYVVALRFCNDGFPGLKDIDENLPGSENQIAGVRYNVIRRPLSGGKGTIRQHKPTKKNPQGESAAAFYARLQEIISEDPGHFFMRWNVYITEQDILKFRRECLDPILEQLCDWWEWVSFMRERGGSVWDNDVQFGARPDKDDNGGHASAIHWRHPFGVYSVLNEGGSSDLDHYLNSGSMAGLTYVDNLFPELTEG
jgi:hypothetical protein